MCLRGFQCVSHVSVVSWHTPTLVWSKGVYDCIQAGETTLISLIATIITLKEIDHAYVLLLTGNTLEVDKFPLCQLLAMKGEGELLKLVNLRYIMRKSLPRDEIYLFD